MRILKHILGKSLVFIVDIGFTPINIMLTKILSLGFSALNGYRIVVKHDGEDWLHEWGNYHLAAHRPILDPELYIHQNLGIFSRFYKLRQNDVVIDVGAGIGTEVLTYSNQVGPLGHIYAIEADPLTFRRLEKTCRLSNITNVTLFNCAVSNSNANVFLKLVSEGGLSNHLTETVPPETNPNHIEVPATTLDDFVQKFGIHKIDFLKMNIEGAEKVALMGFELNYPIVTNWVISCHDFIGSEYGKTFDWVTEWFIYRKIPLFKFKRESKNAYENYYVYAQRQELI